MDQHPLHIDPIGSEPDEITPDNDHHQISSDN
jgi:hypothetical protein